MNAEATPDRPKAATPRTSGALLAAERERQGLSRADIAQRLHISVAQIEALEKSDFERFPRGPFLKGFTRNYARTLGLDAEALVDLVAETTPLAEAPRIVVPSQNIRFDPLGQRLANPYVKAAGIAAAVIVLGFAAMYWWLFIRTAGVPAVAARKPAAEASQDGNPAPPPPAQDAVPSPAPATAGAEGVPPVEAAPSPSVVSATPSGVSAPPPPSPMPAASAVATPAASAPVPAPAAPAPSAGAPRPGDGVIRLAFRSAAWVEIADASGQSLVSRNHPAGTSSEVSGKPPFRVVIGNAPGVSLTYNGREVDLAPHTKVTVARLTLQ
jgi:cytoskeleton protein RodZ